MKRQTPVTAALAALTHRWPAFRAGPVLLVLAAGLLLPAAAGAQGYGRSGWAGSGPWAYPAYSGWAQRTSYYPQYYPSPYARYLPSAAYGALGQMPFSRIITRYGVTETNFYGSTFYPYDWYAAPYTYSWYSPVYDGNARMTGYR